MEHHEGKEPTITEVGWEPYDTCKREDCEYTTYKEIPRLQHNLEHHDGKLPTCTEIGWEAYDTCTDEDCNYTTYKEIPALGHDLEHHEGKEPTITEAGWKPYDTCKREGCDYTTYQELPAHEHQESDWIIDVVGTCVENGTKHKECIVCHITMETAADTSGAHVHTNQSEENYLEATCTQEGYYEVVLFCLDCGQEVSRTPVVIPAKSHELEHHEAKAVTCTERGWDAYDTCKNCSYTTFVEIPAPGHVQDEWIIDIAPTCTTAGEKHVNCLVCGVLIERVGIKALGHSFADEWSFDENNHWKESTCGHDVTTPITPHSYDATWKCTECGYQDTNLHGTAIRTKTLQINGLDLYLSVSNSTSTFSFINEIEVADGAKFGVFTDLECSNEIRSKTGSLKIIGNNTFYILVENGNDIALYTVTIRRRPIYRVSFNSDGGTAVLDQQIEEDSFASLPEITPEKTGYTFTKWMFDFTTPITSNVTIQAQYTPIVYNINYVLKNGTHANPQTYTIEDNYITFSDAEFEDKLFVGWYVKSTTVEGGYEYIAGFSSNKLTDVTVYGAFYGTKGLVINGDTVTGYVGDSSTVVLPLVYKGVVIKNVAEDAFKDNKVIRRIETSSLYYSIPGSAFDGCDLDEIVNDVQVISDGEIIEEPTTDSDFVLAIVKTLGYTAPSDMYYSQDNCLITYVGKELVLGANNSVIPSDGSVTAISAYAFAGRLGITDLTIPDGITSIGEYAFKNCVNIQSITLAQSVTDVATTAFYGCNATLLTGDASAISTIAKNHSKNTTYSVVLTGTSVPTDSFKNCANLISVTIPDSVTSIGDSAFYGCYRLVEVYNKSTLSITAGSSSNGYVAYYAKNVYTTEGGSKLTTDENGYVIYTDGDEKILVAYTGTKTELTLPADITQINTYAFYACSGLTSITIPNSVTSIDSRAFEDCSGLTSITISNSVTSIGSSAFHGCSSLESITIPFVGAKAGVTSSDKNQYPFGYIFGTSNYTGGAATKQYYYGSSTSSTTYDTYYIPSSLKFVTVIGGKILYGAFYNCSGLTSVTIGNSVTRIGDSAFSGCTGLTSITIPDSVTSIGNYAFSGCTGLTSITIPDSVTSIGNYAFSGCTGLTSITIPDSVTSIASEAFSGCSNLTSMTLPFVGASKTASNGYDQVFGYIFGYTTSSSSSSVSGATYQYYGNSKYYHYYIPSSIKSVTITSGSIPSRAFFNCSGLTSVVIPDSVTSIGSSAFYNCSGLTSITIPDSVTSIGNSAFHGCTGLTSITIPDGVTTIGSHTFNNCSGFTSVTLGNSVTSIGDYAFYYCSGLTSIAIPNSVTSIGDYAFYYCSGLTSIAIPNSVTSIGYRTFEDCSGLTSITFPDSVTSIGSSAFCDCTSLTSITIPDSVTTIGACAFYNCSGLTSITIPDSVTNIGGSAFGGTAWYNNQPSGLVYVGKVAYKYKGAMPSNTSIVIKDGTIGIADSAFSGCTGLTSITIPDSVTSIGELAFEDCTGLTSITIPDSVTSIGNCAFSGCTGLTSITIPNSVSSIGDCTFWCCSGLTSVTIPDNVTSIDDSAFYNCSGLTRINFNGTKAQWNAISKGQYWKYNVPSSCKVYCTDGTISI